MNNFHRITLTVIAIILLASCAPDPRKEAQAFEITSQAEQDAANSEQARQHAEALHLLDLQRRQAKAEQWDAAINAIYGTFKIFGSIATAVALIAVAVSFWKTSIGLSDSIKTASLLRANLIHLDKTTRQFPLFVQHIHGTRYALHNANNGSIFFLDERNPADRQMISASGLTQLSGTVAHEARQSSDPAGMAMIDQPMVHAQDGDLTIGAEFIRESVDAVRGDRS